MSESDPASVALFQDVKALPMVEVAARMGLSQGRVAQMIRDGQLLALRREGEPHVPEDFLDGSAVVKGLPGTITVLRDGGYADDDILRWLLADDDSLPGCPLAALRSGRSKEIRRRAQAMAF
jgi:Rv2175c C-terminal domain of unknown function/DNA-binding protein Rv2175c, wHTH domain